MVGTRPWGWTAAIMREKKVEVNEDNFFFERLPLPPRFNFNLLCYPISINTKAKILWHATRIFVNRIKLCVNCFRKLLFVATALIAGSHFVIAWVSEYVTPQQEA